MAPLAFVAVGRAVTKILQLIVKLVFMSLSVQICFDSSVLFE